MKIINPFTFETIRPFRFEKPILDDNGNDTGLRISDDCKLYDNDGNEKHIWYDSNGRPFGYICINEDIGARNYPLTRIAMRAFEDEFHPYSYYNNYQVDHLNPSIPLNNHISNLEWVTQAENMKRAGETGVMIKKYNKPLIHQICQMICDGYSRLEIRNILGVNGQLIDDIRSGRSHKSVSSQYLDKGFSYKNFNRTELENTVNKVCQMIQDGYRNCQIVNKLGIPYNFVWCIRYKYTFKDISSKYNF